MLAAVLGKKGKFAGYFEHDLHKSQQSVARVLEFYQRVSMGDELLHKLPSSLAPPPAA